MKKGKVVLTGVKPTEIPHIGNLVGAMKPVIELSKDADQSYIFIADLHALNAVHDPDLLRRYTIEVAAIYLAMGLDYERSVFFRQSDVPEVTELTSLLMNATPKGLMNRAHAYKDAVAKNAAAGGDPDAGINMGLYTYPILMAADILLYDSDIVPVGKDQKQHVEFARDIAGFFNNTYGDVLKIPEPFIREETGLIPGLDGRKMSKSYGNHIPIFDPEAEMKKKVMRIVTDSKLPDEPKNPDENTIFLIYRHFASDAQVADMRNKFLGGKIGYGDAKKELAELLGDYLRGPRARYEELIKNPGRVMEILKAGGVRAREVAAATLSRVKKAMKLI
jgi:tryptophanyl-tRNA synthetase